VGFANTDRAKNPPEAFLSRSVHLSYRVTSQVNIWCRRRPSILNQVSNVFDPTSISHAPNLHNIVHVQSDICTRSSDIVTPKRPTISSRLKITDRSFTHHVPVLWNALPKERRQSVTHSSDANRYSTAPFLDPSKFQFHS